VVVAPIDEVLVIASDPVEAPTAVGVYVTFTVAVCPGLRVAGNELPEMAKLAPVSATEFTVTALVPAEVSVNVCVED